MSDTIAAALAAFQAEMPVVPKTKTAKVPTKSGGSYSYTYAGLADVTEAAMPLLSKHGLAFVTLPRHTEHGYELAGTLLHSSGEKLEGSLPIHGNSPQEWGSSLTYARRYLIGSITGLVTDDDDDGALASRPSKPAPARKRPPSKGSPPPPERESSSGISEAQVRKLGALMREAGLTERAEALAWVEATIGRPVKSRNELTKQEASIVLYRLQELLATLPAEPPTEDWPTPAEPGEQS